MKFFKGDKIELKRHSNNFDFLRLLGAVLVIIAHGDFLLNGKVSKVNYFKGLMGMDTGRFGVLIFFVISGFLITKSWLNKKSIASFTLARFFRIYPAAIVLILFTVFVIGPFFTSLSFSSYFQDQMTWNYLMNLKIIHIDFYYLPGVFIDNPHGGVNGSLWTLPNELACYLTVMILGSLYLLKNRWAALFSTLFFIALRVTMSAQIDELFIPYISISFNQFYSLFLYFNVGSLFYIWKDHIRFNLFFGLIALLLFIGLNQFSFPNYLAYILIPYFVLCVAFSPLLPFQNSGKHGDFSYGLYIYAFPVQQVILFFFAENLNEFTFFILASIFILIFAYYSWHLVEKPSLNLKNRIFGLKSS